MATTDDKRAAAGRLAGRISRESEKSGRKLSHDEAMQTARKVAERHDRRKD